MADVILSDGESVLCLMALRADAREYRKVNMIQQARLRERVANEIAGKVGLAYEEVK